MLALFGSSINIVYLAPLSISDMAKLRPAGRMLPFNFFLRPVEILLLFKILPNRHLKASKNGKLEKKNAEKILLHRNSNYKISILK